MKKLLTTSLIIGCIVFNTFAQVVTKPTPNTGISGNAHALAIDPTTQFLTDFNPKRFDADSITQVQAEIERTVRRKKFNDALSVFIAEMDSDFKILDAAFATNEQVQTVLQNRKLTDTISFRHIRVRIEEKIAIIYNGVFNFGCDNAEIEFDLSQYKNISREIELSNVQTQVYMSQMSCNQVDPFPTVVITKEYSDYLHDKIARVLSTYSSLNTNITQYDEVEKRKNLATLKATIEYRGRFLKYCLTKI